MAITLERFHTAASGTVRISADQGSRFAKEVAQDFNPIHDAGAKRFCVPGDLLFALVLGYYGLSRRMAFSFREMVGSHVSLRFPESDDARIDITDQAGKLYLRVDRHGETTRDPAVVEAFVRRYAAFSGRNFPDFLEPLMVHKGIMFNPDRPLVIYDSMAFDLHRPASSNVVMELIDASLEIIGKRGEEILRFHLIEDGQVIGSGSKRVVLGGLQAYDHNRLQRFVDHYTARRRAFPG
ncbi:MAG: DUF3581 family protein [Aquisalimonadaceae bacterium]